MTAKEKKKRCLRRILIGLFLIITGIGLSVDIFVNKPYLFYESWRYQALWRTIAWAILILWNAAGLCFLVYGWSEPCPED